MSLRGASVVCVSNFWHRDEARHSVHVSSQPSARKNYIVTTPIIMAYETTNLSKCTLVTSDLSLVRMPKPLGASVQWPYPCETSHHLCANCRVSWVSCGSFVTVGGGIWAHGRRTDAWHALQPFGNVRFAVRSVCLTPSDHSFLLLQVCLICLSAELQTKPPLNFPNLSCEVGMPISKNFTFVSSESQTLRILYLFKYEKIGFFVCLAP